MTQQPHYGAMSNPTEDPTTALSDYGSDIGLEDFDEVAVLAGVLRTIEETRPTARSAVLPSIEFEEGELEDEEQNVQSFAGTGRPTTLRVAKSWRESVELVGAQKDTYSSPPRRRQRLEVEYEESSRRSWSVPLEESSGGAAQNSLNDKTLRTERTSSPGQAVELASRDSRSPLERFRTKPKKPLSVTDLVSPAWCELQYLYTLSKFGRKPRTQAMRLGTKIHQKLEDEVHTTVPVQVSSKVDMFGLRIWNAISGLQCLRETGLTRELEVWGVIAGQVVNGVIDELSYQCPDPVFEDQLDKAKNEKTAGNMLLPADQPTIMQALSKSGPQQEIKASTAPSEPALKVYIADVKTRSVQSVPGGASLRPTKMQLMLYRRLLASLASNLVDADVVFARYDVEPLEAFTDTFLQEVGGIGPHNEALHYPNLLSLWSLLITEMQSILPPSSLSNILRAEFRYAKTGDIIGSELMLYDDDVVDSYIVEKMGWWKGTREAKGVEMEEAFKCRICDFAEECSWREAKIDEATEKSRLRRQAKEKSAV